MIRIVNISKTFNKDRKPLQIFNNLSINIEDDKLTTILGRSGSGKSTLLNMIGSLDKPDCGEIFVDDIEVVKLSHKETLKFRNEKVGFVFQSFYLESSLSVIDNICLPLAIRGVQYKERINKAKELLKWLNIEDKQDEDVRYLSGGEQQRVCIARALITEPNLILADEPTGHLDYENGQEVMKILKKIAEDGKTVILVTHNVEDAKKYSNRILYLKDGILSEYGD